MPEPTKQEKIYFHRELLEKINTLVGAGLGLVAALAWNDAIQSLFRLVFQDAQSLIAKFVYAVLITVVVVLITMRLSSLASRLKK